MDLRVTDNQIQPILSRIRPSAPMPGNGSDPALPLAPAERDAITKALEAAAIPYTIAPESQPDPTLLAALQGKVATRTQALAALAAGKPPITIADLALRLDKAAADITTLQSKVAIK